MTSILAYLAISSPVLIQGTTEFSNGLQTTSFDLPEGRVVVLLPGDLAPGDTISGTVIRTPKGVGEEAIRNGSILNGLVISIEEELPKKGEQQPTWIIPTMTTGAVVLMMLETPEGKPVAECSVPTLPEPVQPFHEGKFSCDPVVQAGTPIQVQGPFDGNLDNTSGKCGSEELSPIAESPRSCVYVGMPTSAGPTNVSIQEADKNASLPCNVAAVQLSASKATLLEGEKATVTMTVSGLQGVPESAYPIELELENLSPGVISFDGGSNFFADAIAFNMVSNGMCTMSIGIVGIRPGNFQVRGLFGGVKTHKVKQNMDTATFEAWVRGLVLAYEARIAALEAELAKNPNDRGLQLNIQRKKGILSAIRACQNTRGMGLSNCKTIVDTQLAKDQFFAMASDMITAAADLLGYTSIPMPNVSTIVKGIKALAGAAKLTKTLNALATVEKLIEEYEKLQNAADKLKKAQEIKEAIDKVKEALDAGE